MWVLGLYKLSWPANGSFKYVDIFVFACLFVFCLFVCFLFCFVFLVVFGGGVGEGRNVKGERGSWGRGRRGYIVLCIY